MTQTKPKTLEGLAQFTGTEHYYFSPPFSNFNYTDGVKYLADKAGAHWFKDEVLARSWI